MVSVAVLIKGSSLSPFLFFPRTDLVPELSVSFLVSTSGLVEVDICKKVDVICFVSNYTLVPVNWLSRIAYVAYTNNASVIPLQLVPDDEYSRIPELSVPVGIEGILAFNNTNSLLEATQPGLVFFEDERFGLVEGMCFSCKGNGSSLVQTHCGVVPSHVAIEIFRPSS